MKMDLIKKVVNSAKLGIWITATVTIFETLLSFLKIETIQLYGIQPVSGISPTIGRKVIELVGGVNILNLDFMSLFTLFISATAIVFVGSLLYGLLNIPKGLAGWKELAIILVYGSLAFYLVFAGFKMLPWGSIVMFAIYTGVLAISLYYLRNFAQKFIPVI